MSTQFADTCCTQAMYAHNVLLTSFELTDGDSSWTSWLGLGLGSGSRLRLGLGLGLG